MPRPCQYASAKKGHDLMGCIEDQTTKTLTVMPGAKVEGSLSSAGVLRFERCGDAMTGEPVLSVENGALALHYADGASVYINA